jgi:hypothetical protein
VLCRNRAWRNRAWVVAVALGAVACGSTVSSSGDCYDSAIATAQGCLPPATAVGLLNDAGTACTYDGGVLVTFPSLAGYASSFVVSSPGGGLCLSYQESADGGSALQTAAGTTVVSSRGSITCANGAADPAEVTVVGSISGYAGAASFEFVLDDGGEAQAFNCSN